MKKQQPNLLHHFYIPFGCEVSGYEWDNNVISDDIIVNDCLLHLHKQEIYLYTSM